MSLLLNMLSAAAATAAVSIQLCRTLCDPIDGSPPGSPVRGILQARTLGWVAISFSNAWKWKVKVTLLSHVRLFATPWTAAYQAPPPMRFSRQKYWVLPLTVYRFLFFCLESFSCSDPIWVRVTGWVFPTTGVSLGLGPRMLTNQIWGHNLCHSFIHLSINYLDWIWSIIYCRLFGPKLNGILGI